MIIILFGAPGVGKGTQAQILARNLGIAHLSTGDAFRTAIANKTEIGLLAQSYVDAGDLVPDSVTAKIVQEAMAASDFQNGCILDGFPRTQQQAAALDEILAAAHKHIHKVVNLEVDNETIVSRLMARGRQDDTKEIIQNRLNVYQQETAPLVEHYLHRGLLTNVNGIGTVEEVSNRILKAVQTA